MIINVMRGILGTDYSKQIAAETLMARSMANNIRTDLVRLQSTRFVSASETNKGYRFDEGLIKALSGGDVVTARGMRQVEIEYTPEFKLFIATNHMPKFSLNDQALLERVLLIPFEVTIPREQRDPNFPGELLAEES
jgi:putative DNA primase/helicase